MYFNIENSTTINLLTEGEKYITNDIQVIIQSIKVLFDEMFSPNVD